MYPVLRSTASRLARKMSCHITGSLAGDPCKIAETAGSIAEYLEVLAALGQANPPGRTPAGAADGWSPPALRRDRLDLHRSTSAPSARHRSVDHASACALGVLQGRQDHLVARNSSDLEASTPLFSEPAIGWPGTNAPACRQRLADRPPHCPWCCRLGQTTACPDPGQPDRPASFPWPGSARPTGSHRRPARSRKIFIAAIHNTQLQRQLARWRGRDRPHHFAAYRPPSRKPLANEPPINPRPTTTRRPI